ncbi:Transposon Ty3-I Gag-Pol poly, partial [Paramuricea clavata]
MPESLWKRTVELAHEGHQGIVRTKSRLREKVWWPKIDKQVEDYVRSCHPCQIVGGSKPKPEPIRSTKLPESPWKDISVDLLEITSESHLLVVVDYYSRWVEAILLRKTDAQHVIKSLEAIFRTHGLPETIRSDNGPPFASRDFEAFLKSLGIIHKKGVPYWPQSNGGVERCNETLLKIVRIARIEVTGTTPAELLMGRKLREKLPRVEVNESRVTETERKQLLKERDARVKLRQKEYADKTRAAQDSNISEGDRVLLKQTRKNKLTSSFEPLPYRVIRREGNAVVIQDSGGDNKMRGIAHMKKYVEPQVVETRETLETPVILHEVEESTAQPTKTRIYAFGSSEPVELKGKFEVLVDSKRCVAAATFYVTKGTQGTASILGCETSTNLRLITMNVNNSRCRKYRKSRIGKLKGHEQKIHINTDVPPVAQTNRRVPFHLHKQLDTWLDDYLQKDIIEPVSDESTDWVSGLVLAPKPRNPNEVRVCGDYRQANTAIKREKHPIPTVDELMESMNGAIKYSKIDLKAPNHQIPLEKSSSQREVFQHAIENAIRGIDGVRKIADDIIVWGSTQQEHNLRLEQLFALLDESGLTVNNDKCLFDQRELWFYGFLLTDSGIKVDPRKVDAIKHAKEPKDTKELRSFLGLGNYCSRFIKNFSTLTSPLRELTVAKTPYAWTPIHTAAFAAIKEAIQKDCIMHFYDPNQKTCLTVDASPTGLGAILSNIDRA